MTDRVSTEKRSRMMAAVRGADTLPELYVRKKLFAAGFRFRLHAKELVGKPDIVLPRFRMVVFVHGCFWHGHSCSRGRRPASNVEFWNAKIDGNVRRDRNNRVVLKASGWSSVVIWECRLERATEALLRRLKTLNAFQRD
jgi:DNA mismatch endonuclease (patch repair protein)